MKPERDDERRSRLTVEAAAWIALAAVALVLRLAALDRASLSTAEAGQAMLAWRAATGQGMPSAGIYSPLLLWGNGLLFWLCGPRDATARLLPALFGVALALSPLVLRKPLGRVGALAAGCYLAISPAALLASRQLDGSVVAALGGLLVLGCAVRFGETNDRRWLFAGAVSAAVAVTAGAWAGGMLATLGLAWAGWAWVRAEGELSSAWRAARPHLLVLCGTLALGTIVLATGVGWNGDGLASLGRMIVGWARGLREVSGQPAASPLTLIMLYEPLALVSAIGALIVAIRKSDRFVYLVAAWAVLATLLVAAAEGRRPLDVIIAVAPLALLAGRAVDYLARSLQRDWNAAHEGLLALGIIVLLGTLYLVLTRYSGSSALYDLALYAALAGLLILLLASAAFAIGFLISPGAGIRGAALGLGLGLLVYTLAGSWSAAYIGPDDPRELLVYRPTPGNVRDLVDTLRGLSWRQTGTEASLRLATDARPDSVLGWYLKDFESVDWVEDLGVVTGMYDVLVGEGVELSDDEAAFVGQDFALRTTWNPAALACPLSWPPTCGPAVNWLLLRDTEAPLETEDVAVVWARRELVVIETPE